MSHARSILITGTSSGIGLDAALTLQERGHRVIASCRKASDVEKLEAKGLKHVVVLDLADSASIREGLESALSLCHGELNGVFNNGAYGQPGAVEDLSREALRKQFEVNVFGTHELTTLAIPHLLKARSPRIIQNSSVLGFFAMPMRGAYVASKFALEGLSDALRQELSETPIQLSIVEPGPIATRFRENALTALRDNIDIPSSRHQARYKGALERLQKKGASSSFTLGPEAVTRKVVHAFESKRPRVRYYVTVPTYLFAVLRHWLPYRSIDRLAILAAKSEG